MAEPFVIADLRGGRNGIDSPLDPLFPKNQCAESINVELVDSPCGSKRGGADAVSTAGGTAVGNGIRALFRHVPGGDETLAEWWMVDGNGVVKRYSGGAWADVTLSDAITGSKSEVAFCTLNSKLVIAYKSGVNRLHVYDPDLAAPRVRRHGLAVSSAPTAANQGGGAYAATLRYYRQRTIQLDAATSTRLIRRSEPSASVSITPSGAGLSIRVTRGAFPGEGETHWEIEVSSDNLNWSVLYGFGVTGTAGAAIAIGTTTQDDTYVVGNYGLLPASDLLGTYTLFPSAKFLTTDNNRLIAAGSNETASESHESRIWFSAVLGTDKGDDERWVSTSTQKNRIDLSEKNGGRITGLTPTINGTFWAGKYRRITRCTPTTDASEPYIVKDVSGRVGFVNHWSIVDCQDAAGEPSIAFLSFQGPHRLGAGGLEYCGRDVEDVWRGLFTYAAAGKFNRTASITPAFGTWYDDKRQIWFWIATGANTSPNVRLRWDVRQAQRKDRYGVRGGWVVDTGDVAAYCACPFAGTLGAAVSLDLKPHTGRSDSLLYQHDTTTTTDNGTTFRAYQQTRCLNDVDETMLNEGVLEPYVVARAAANSQLHVQIMGDFNLLPSHADITLDAETLDDARVIRKVGGSNASDIGAVQILFGDDQARASTWSVDAIIVPRLTEGAK